MAALRSAPRLPSAPGSTASPAPPPSTTSGPRPGGVAARSATPVTNSLPQSSARRLLAPTRVGSSIADPGRARGARARIVLDLDSEAAARVPGSDGQRARCGSRGRSRSSRRDGSACRRLTASPRTGSSGCSQARRPRASARRSLPGSSASSAPRRLRRQRGSPGPDRAAGTRARSSSPRLATGTCPGCTRRPRCSGRCTLRRQTASRSPNVLRGRRPDRPHGANSAVPLTPVDGGVEAEKKADSPEPAVEDARVLRLSDVQFQLNAAPRAQERRDGDRASAPRRGPTLRGGDRRDADRS